MDLLCIYCFMLIASHDKSLIVELKAQLSHEFDMKDFGSTKKILGMEIQCDRRAGTLFQSQKSYIEKVFEKYNLSNCKSVATPFASHFKLSSRQCPVTEVRKTTCLTFRILMLLGISCML
jgi:hypothetical protein